MPASPPYCARFATHKHPQANHIRKPAVPITAACVQASGRAGGISAPASPGSNTTATPAGQRGTARLSLAAVLQPPGHPDTGLTATSPCWVWQPVGWVVAGAVGRQLHMGPPEYGRRPPVWLCLPPGRAGYGQLALPLFRSGQDSRPRNGGWGASSVR